MQNSDDPFRWDDARVLLALLNRRTLSGAASRLGVNTSTVGRRLDALEAALGGRLFNRTPDGVLPTALAEELAPHAENLERSAASFAMAAAGREVLAEGEVRLTAPPGIAEHLLAPALKRLVARWPKLRITLDASVGRVDLARREADLALRVVPPTTGDLVMKKLGEVSEVLLASRSYAEELGNLRRLDRARFVTWGEDLAQIPSAQWVARAVSSESVVLRTSSIGAQLGAVQAGLGVALLGRQYAKLRGLVEVRFAGALERKLAPWPKSALWLVGHRALRDVPRVAAVWTFLEEEARRALSDLAPA